MGKKITKFWTGLLDRAVTYSIHVSIIVLAVVAIFGDILWSDEFSQHTALAQGGAIQDVDPAKVDIFLSYLSELAPPLHVYGDETDHPNFLSEGSGFLSKPSLTNTIVSALQRENVTTYIVSAGETYWTIAYKFEININTLKWANDIQDMNGIKPGDKLTILPVNGLLYVVSEGETLRDITKFYGVSEQSIKAQNKLVSADLTAGQQLVIPGAKKYSTYAVDTTVTADKMPYEGVIAQGSGTFAWPTETAQHFITQYFAWITQWYKHTGLDLDSRNGTDVFASDRGTVVSSSYGYGGGYGNHIVIDHGNGFQTLYAHNAENLVTVGDTVEKGQKIANMGSTGYSTGTHVHFEIRFDGKAVNPLAYLP